MKNSEKNKQLAKFFFNKIINELNNELINESENFSKFLQKKTLSVPNDKKETVCGGIILNTIFAFEYVLKFENDQDGLKKIKTIAKKLESKKTETDKMLSSVIETEINMSLSHENCLAIFTTSCFHSFVDLLEIETALNLKETISEMLSGIIVSFLETHNSALVVEALKEAPPFFVFLTKNTTLN